MQNRENWSELFISNSSSSPFVPSTKRQLLSETFIDESHFGIYREDISQETKLKIANVIMNAADKQWNNEGNICVIGVVAWLY